MLEHPFQPPRKTTFNALTLSRDKVVADLGLTEEKQGTKFSGLFQDEEVSGTVWFSTSNQLGLVVDAWGPALLIFQFSENGYIATRVS